MTVGAHVQFKDTDSESLYFPLATESDFALHWVPAAEKRGLRWIPQFQTGVPVAFDDLNSVLDEFRLLRTDFENRKGAEMSLFANYVTRIDRILEVLQSLDQSEIEEIFIG